MQLQIESPHIETSEKLIDLIQAKFDHLGKRYNRIHSCTIILRKEKSDVQKNYSIEAKMEVPRSILFASEKDESFEKALSKLLDDLVHQLEHFKEEIREPRP